MREVVGITVTNYLRDTPAEFPRIWVPAVLRVHQVLRGDSASSDGVLRKLQFLQQLPARKRMQNPRGNRGPCLKRPKFGPCRCLSLVLDDSYLTCQQEKQPEPTENARDHEHVVHRRYYCDAAVFQKSTERSRYSMRFLGHQSH